MKLTPLDVQQHEFPRSLSGYDRQEVRSFLQFVARELQVAFDTLAERDTEVQRLQGEVFRFKEREDMLKDALVTAQRLAEDMRTQAKKEADLVLAEAELKGERIIHHAHARLLTILEEISDLKQQRVQLQEQLRHVLTTHQKMLDVESDTPSAETAVAKPLSYLDPKKTLGRSETQKAAERHSLSAPSLPQPVDADKNRASNAD